MAKKGTNQKVPEKSATDRINHYKGIVRGVKKQMDNLEKRLYELEQRFTKLQKRLPDPAKCINSEPDKNIREEMNRKFNPKFKEANE